MRRLTALALLPTLLVSGCAVGPKYNRPAVNSPTTYYLDSSPQSNSVADLAWWDLFKDPVLQGLIEEALKNNYDVRIAASRVEEERAQIGIARSIFFPQIGYAGSISGQRAPLVPNHTYYGYNLNLSWELDLWGRIRRLNEQQRAVFLATEEAQRGVWLSLVSDVAQAYFELRALDAQREITIETGQSFQETFDLFNKKLEGGAASAIETSRAEGALANVLAQIPDLQRQITAKENQISLLLGKNPGPIPRGAILSAQYDLDAIPAGLPSTLLERRPDLRQAEQQMIAANAAVGVAKANFFPVINSDRSSRWRQSAAFRARQLRNPVERCRRACRATIHRRALKSRISHFANALGSGSALLSECRHTFVWRGLHRTLCSSGTRKLL